MQCDEGLASGEEGSGGAMVTDVTAVRRLNEDNERLQQQVRPACCWPLDNPERCC